MNPAVANTQLLFVDLQAAILANSRTNPPSSIAAAASVLALAADLLGLPMTFALVPEASKLGVVIPELQPFATDANSFRRTTSSPFLSEDVTRHLLNQQRRVLVIAGCSTEVGILHTALDALAAGYEVIIPVDAIGSRSPRTEEAVIRQMEIAGAVVTSLRSLLMRLAPDLAVPPAAEILQFLRDLENHC